MTKDQKGDVWTVVDPVMLVTSKNGGQLRKQLSSGDAAVVGSDEALQFRVESNSHVRLILVKPKMAHQELTVGPFILDGSIEDASDRNATLLVAITGCRFRDIRNLGDESQWFPSKPSIVTLNSGNVRWIRPGIHHFKNLGQKTARLVSIEW